MSRKRPVGRGSTNPKQPWEAMLLNDWTFIDYYNRLRELCINMFEWKNLPDSCDERFLELTLMELGYAVFYRDDVADRFVALTAMYSGPLDIYRIPKWRRAYATNGYNYQLSGDDSVLIFNNYLHEPSILPIILYARRLYEIERAIDVNVKGQKTPIVIMTDKEQEFTMRQFFQKYDGNEPIIIGSKNLDLSGVTAVKTDVPFVSDKLMLLKHQVWDEALTYLGIENSNTDKRERLITDEVQSNLGAVEAQRFTKLNARRQAADQINRMFGLNIEVDFRATNSTTGQQRMISETSEPGEAIE